jgi:hypothetical protein
MVRRSAPFSNRWVAKQCLLCLERHRRHWTKPLRGKNQVDVQFVKPGDLSESLSTFCSRVSAFTESWSRCLQQIHPTKELPMTSLLRLRMLGDMQIRNLAVNTQV